MTKYFLPLTEQETLNLRQLALQPGFDVVLKFLQHESFEALEELQECKGNKEQRLLALTDYQSTVKIVSKLTKKLAAYREIALPTPDPDNDDPLEFNAFTERTPN